jgi:hypothetical protein
VAIPEAVAIQEVLAITKVLGIPEVADLTEVHLTEGDLAVDMAPPVVDTAGREVGPRTLATSGSGQRKIPARRSEQMVRRSKGEKQGEHRGST